MRILTIIFLFINLAIFAQSDDSTEFYLLKKPINPEFPQTKATANDNCSGATSLTVDGGCTNGTTATNSVEAGEAAAFPCNAIGGGGVTGRSSWYRVNTGALTEMNFLINGINGPTNCGYHIAVYGPFAVGGGCLPTAAQSVYCEDFLDLWDPGFSFQVTGMTAGADYLVQVMNEDCGGGNPRTIDYCIGAYSVPGNNTANTSSVIDQCGITYSGTNIGYTPTNGLPGNEDLDNNAATTCGTCTAGDDVAYVVNNDSWFSFCATTAGTWNVDFSGISNCFFSSGLQMTIFRGTPGNLTEIENAPSPSAPGSSWTSANFAVAAGECIYLVVDGFGGDQCDYSYTLNNVTGGCNLLLNIELGTFTGFADGTTNVIEWTTLSETNNDYFVIEKSLDGENFVAVEKINGAGDSFEEINYNFVDRRVDAELTYYRIKQVDYNGEYSYTPIVAIKNHLQNKTVYKTFDLLGRPVNSNYVGFAIVVYTDGTKEKVYLK
ncbi:MAG: hypothetical protein ACWA41_12945 [Putridiphycobacter sp.]